MSESHTALLNTWIEEHYSLEVLEIRTDLKQEQGETVFSATVGVVGVHTCHASRLFEADAINEASAKLLLYLERQRRGNPEQLIYYQSHGLTIILDPIVVIEPYRFQSWEDGLTQEFGEHTVLLLVITYHPSFGYDAEIYIDGEPTLCYNSRTIEGVSQVLEHWEDNSASSSVVSAPDSRESGSSYSSDIEDMTSEGSQESSLFSAHSSDAGALSCSDRPPYPESLLDSQGGRNTESRRDVLSEMQYQPCSELSQMTPGDRGLSLARERTAEAQESREGKRVWRDQRSTQDKDPSVPIRSQSFLCQAAKKSARAQRDLELQRESESGPTEQPVADPCEGQSCQVWSLSRGSSSTTTEGESSSDEFPCSREMVLSRLMMSFARIMSTPY